MGNNSGVKCFDGQWLGWDWFQLKFFLAGVDRNGIYSLNGIKLDKIERVEINLAGKWSKLESIGLELILLNEILFNGGFEAIQKLRTK